MSKKMYLLPVVLFLLFIIVFVVFLKVDLDIGDYEYVTVKYVASLSFLLLGLLSTVTIVLLNKNRITIKAMSVMLSIAFTLIFSAGLVVSIYGYNTSYFLFNCEPLAQNIDGELQHLYPYRDSNDDTHCTIDANSCVIAEYIDIYQMNKSYELEFFSSASITMNRKFDLLKNPANPIDEFSVKTIDFSPEKKIVDDVKLYLYVDGDNFEARITGIYHSCFISLHNADDVGVTKDDFVKEAVKQYKFVKQLSKDKVLSNPIYRKNLYE